MEGHPPLHLLAEIERLKKENLMLKRENMELLEDNYRLARNQCTECYRTL